MTGAGKMKIKYPRPPMNLAWQNPASATPDLYVGGMEAAADTNYLTRHGVGTSQKIFTLIDHND